MESVVTVQPHDLLRLSGDVALPPGAPQWVRHALSTTPWAVARRAAAARGFIAAGVRGPTRSARFALDVDPADVDTVVKPEDLAHDRPRNGRCLPAFHALESIRPVLDNARVTWGPTGSVGFELATGSQTVTETSDLDLIVRLTTARDLDRLRGIEHGIGARVDCQLETPAGAVALAELTGDGREIMLRTADGPRLVARALVIA